MKAKGIICGRAGLLVARQMMSFSWYNFHVINFILNLGDGNWYRALVKEIVPNGNIKVHFVDYGNIGEVTADELQMIPSEFLTLPFQGIQCWLVGMM